LSTETSQTSSRRHRRKSRRKVQRRTASNKESKRQSLARCERSAQGRRGRGTRQGQGRSDLIKEGLKDLARRCCLARQSTPRSLAAWHDGRWSDRGRQVQVPRVHRRSSQVARKPAVKYLGKHLELDGTRRASTTTGSTKRSSVEEMLAEKPAKPEPLYTVIGDNGTEVNVYKHEQASRRSCVIRTPKKLSRLESSDARCGKGVAIRSSQSLPRQQSNHPRIRRRQDPPVKQD